ncbi:hypothetical protein RRG08_009780 [Elysia crispata]|uniref:Uncharacterized protein n=1 Tax=Elysia crispata TaxID=231223 RepID=A0AAE1DLI7_9GAST|nr:hypothetical protein RRG08_009780 [Elysia crispata]
MLVKSDSPCKPQGVWSDTRPTALNSTSETAQSPTSCQTVCRSSSRENKSWRLHKRGNKPLKCLVAVLGARTQSAEPNRSRAARPEVGSAWPLEVTAPHKQSSDLGHRSFPEVERRARIIPSLSLFNFALLRKALPRNNINPSYTNECGGTAINLPLSAVPPSWKARFPGDMLVRLVIPTRSRKISENLCTTVQSRCRIRRHQCWDGKRGGHLGRELGKSLEQKGEIALGTKRTRRSLLSQEGGLSVVPEESTIPLNHWYRDLLGQLEANHEDWLRR